VRMDWSVCRMQVARSRADAALRLAGRSSRAEAGAHPEL